MHAIVKVDAKNYPQYKERVDYLYDIMQKNGLKIDKQNKNPSRLTRLPGFDRGDKKQFLVATNIGKVDWEEWQEYVEDLNDNLPDIENLEGLFDKPIELAPELIQGVLRQGHKMLIAGPSKAGKSFLLINLVLSIANGKEWLGFKCTQGKVLYVNLELDGRSAKQRFVDICNALGYDHRNITNVDIWNLRGKTSPMDKLAPKLIRRAKDANYIAIVIDPIYKVLTGDENNAHDMADFVNQFDRIATELDCAVIYAHHHSKGAQGGKSSIDRSSGSGVFARDPDAILDLIQLPIDEARYDALENRVSCRTFYQTIAKYRPDYLNQISESDMLDKQRMGHHVMVSINRAIPNYEDVLKENSQRMHQAVDNARNETAWRVEGTLREFPKFKPVNVWFEYPVHTIDASLDDIELETTGNNSWKQSVKKSNERKAQKSQFELEEAFNILSEDGGPIEITAVADYLEIQKPNVYRRIKKSEKFEASDGMMFKKEGEDNLD